VVVSESDLVAAVTRDRAAGKRLGFTTIAFDLLRAHHVRALHAAAAKSDRLVVAVVDDHAPHVVTLEDRAELVDGLRGVDYVIVCSAERIDRLAAILIPDVRA
jgi:bifunctional ADP-heptose synthase (sugar kinase/adenylyltransferase)